MLKNMLHINNVNYLLQMQRQEVQERTPINKCYYNFPQRSKIYTS